MSQIRCVQYSSLPGVSVPLVYVRKTVGVLRWVNSNVKCKGLERSQFWRFCPYMLLLRVLKGVIFWGKTQGSWNESISDRFAVIVTAGVLKGVNFGEMSCMPFKLFMMCSHSSRWSQRLMLKVGMTFCWPISQSCTMQGVKFLEVGLLVLGQVLWMEWWAQHDVEFNG